MFGFKVGEKVMIRSVTYHYAGVVQSVSEDEVVLTDACWVADSGRFSEALVKGTFREVEKYPNPVHVSTQSITDWTTLDCELPKHTI